MQKIYYQREKVTHMVTSTDFAEPCSGSDTVSGIYG